MLYLEDYLEMIENLPMEMRERLTEMRETDLQVQRVVTFLIDSITLSEESVKSAASSCPFQASHGQYALDSLEEQVKVFFKKCLQPNLKPDWKEEQYKKIHDEYQKALNDADEKVQLANHIHDLVDRHARRLDQELSKFKMELEADNAGITETLEKRSLELDKPQPPQPPQRSEKRRGMHSTASLHNHADKRPTTEVLSSLANEVARESLTNIHSSSASNSPALKMFSSGSSSSLSYSLGHIGAGSNAAIAAAASQAIAATQQVGAVRDTMSQGRRTSSMKASYDLMTKSMLSKELTLPMGTTSSAPSTPEPTTQRSQRTKKQTSKAAALAQQLQQQQTAQPAATVPTATAEGTDETGAELQVDDWQPDPNEPRYCLCNQVSYGDMVGCDNEDCPIEWFHYGCVGLTQAPKGKWFCPQCTAAMKRRGRR